MLELEGGWGCKTVFTSCTIYQYVIDILHLYNVFSRCGEKWCKLCITIMETTTYLFHKVRLRLDIMYIDVYICVT